MSMFVCNVAEILHTFTLRPAQHFYDLPTRHRGVFMALTQSNSGIVLKEFFHKCSNQLSKHRWHFKDPFQTKSLIPWRCGPEPSFGQVFALKNTIETNWRQVMKKILTKYRTSNRDDSAMPGRHIHFLRIRAFASEGIIFTEEENAHFDVCRVCRLKVIDALRNLPLVVCSAMSKAA